MAKIELTTELVSKWKFEIAKQAETNRQGARDAGNELSRQLNAQKAEFLEGAFTVLTCLERAASKTETDQ